jgi:hypothetical protein
VLVGVGQDQPGRRQHQHGDVPADLVALVDGRLVVHEVGDDGLVGDRGADGGGHHVGVVAGLLDRHPQVVGAVVDSPGGPLAHAAQHVTRHG